MLVSALGGMDEEPLQAARVGSDQLAETEPGTKRQRLVGSPPPLALPPAATTSNGPLNGGKILSTRAIRSVLKGEIRLLQPCARISLCTHQLAEHGCGLQYSWCRPFPTMLRCVCCSHLYTQAKACPAKLTAFATTAMADAASEVIHRLCLHHRCC